ncbi:hypothetical protein ASE52_12845 [Acidovorax sp. Root275]|nr:hypothetical protein ASE52_12845 [Acidovorax sp. Root275]
MGSTLLPITMESRSTPTLSSATAMPNPMNNDQLFAGCRYQEQPGAPHKTALAYASSQINGARLIECPFFPHGWALDTRRKERAFFFEKHGTGAGVFDLQQQRFVRTIPPFDQRQFYGHGVLAGAGELLLSTESDPQGQGFIGMRDTNTLRYLGDFPSFGARPHDCHLVDNGRVLAVTNGGAKAGESPAPCISYIDVETHQLLDRHDMPGSAFNTGHMVPVSGSTALIASAPRLGLGVDHEGAVSWCHRSEATLRGMPYPQDRLPRLLGEALSIALLPHERLAVVTHPTPGVLTFWRLDDQSLWHSMPVDNVRGVALAGDGHSLWLSHGAQGSLSILRMDGREPSVQPVLRQAPMAGSHLLNYPVALATALASPA